MRKSIYHLIFLSPGILSLSLLAHEWNGFRPDGHAPIAVMGDHTHKAGEWMFSYRYMFMEMEDNRTGTNRASDAQVLADFPVTPTAMSMEMHMFGAMWTPIDKTTFMAMLPYVRNEMDHLTRMGMRFETESEGIGDLRTTSLIHLFKWDHHKIHLNAGVGFPTGSINEKDFTPMGHVRLPYPMQIGSGTFDLFPGVTYLGQTYEWSWGAQIIGTLRLGRNDNDYSLGDRIFATLWGAYRWSDWISSSVRLDVESWGNVDGADPKLDPALVPTADPGRRGGTRSDFGIGINFYGGKGLMNDHRVALEWEIPFYQDLQGPQLETDWILTVGWQKTW